MIILGIRNGVPIGPQVTYYSQLKTEMSLITRPLSM